VERPGQTEAEANLIPESRRSLRSFLAGLWATRRRLDHFVYHSPDVPPCVSVATEEVTHWELVTRLEWARPTGPGRFPAVLVHPEAGKTAADMRGVINDLAGRGFVALAADYRRFTGGKYDGGMFPWKDEAEAETAFRLLAADPAVDRNRIGALGFSQGGVYGLLLAAQLGAGLKAVVAYYPVADLTGLVGSRLRGNLFERGFRSLFRAMMRSRSGAATDAEFAALLRRGSALFHAEKITAAVLLIHGADDLMAPVEQSVRLHRRLKALGRTTDLLVIPGAIHAFNFRDRDQAALAWDATTRWLDEHLKHTEK
jgi:dipeptidyl aminopeptidase/acylaminoacyl peptidase